MMATISKSDRIKLQDVSINEIKGIMTDLFESNYTKLDILSENSNELKYVTRHNGNHAQIELTRKTHRPLDLDITVKYMSSNIKEESFKSPQSKFFGSLSKITFGFTSILIIIAMIYIVFFSGVSTLPFILRAILMFIFLVFSISLIIYQFLPENQKFGYKRKQQKLELLLDQVKGILLQLREDTDAEMKKCWNCFKDIEKNNNCPFCGKSQN